MRVPFNWMGWGRGLALKKKDVESELHVECRCSGLILGYPNRVYVLIQSLGLFIWAVSTE